MDVSRAEMATVLPIDTIQQLVAERFGMPIIDMVSARRAKAIARPRQIAMYLCRHYTRRSLPEIGRRFGGRDHTTVIHAIKVVSLRRENDQETADHLAMLERELAAVAAVIAAERHEPRRLDIDTIRRAAWHGTW